MKINIEAQEEYERDVEKCIKAEMQTFYPEEYERVYGNDNTTSESLSSLRQEINFFKQLNLWSDGYIEGDPLDPSAVPNITTNILVLQRVAENRTTQRSKCLEKSLQ